MPHVSRIVAVVALSLVLLWTTAAAQPRYDLVGSVQWVSGNRLQLWTNGGPIAVDVSRVAQSDYAGLRTGDVIRVIGYLAPDRLRVVAETIERDLWPGPQTP